MQVKHVLKQLQCSLIEVRLNTFSESGDLHNKKFICKHQGFGLSISNRSLTVALYERRTDQNR
jgi:hypothetical protein